MTIPALNYFQIAAAQGAPVVEREAGAEFQLVSGERGFSYTLHMNMGKDTRESLVQPAP